MRPIIKSLLFTCAVCAVAQGPAARAQTPATPSPTAQPSPTPPSPATPITPATPATPASPTSNPPDPASKPPDPAIPDQNTPPPVDQSQPPITQDQVPAPDTTIPNDSVTPVDNSMTPVAVDIDPGPDSNSYAWSDDTLQSGIGVSTILGGGVVGFTDKTMRNTASDVGGLWNLRVTLGSHIPLGLDVSYLGTAMNLNGLPSGQNGTLIGTTVEGAVRYNVLPHYRVNPYVFAGIGWQRYDVTEANVSLSDSGMNDMDNLVEFPMGAGLSYRRAGFVGDLRGTFRAATEQDLVLKTTALTPGAPTSDDFAPMHTWEASAALGYEF
jgi:hypothetical protein